MEEAVTCAVCSEVYQKGPREPLVLPCGHTFCRSCLFNLHSSPDFLCPTCRRDHSHLEMDKVPLCFSLLGLSATYMGSQREMCREHRGELSYWCRECEMPLCGLCLYFGHPPGHDVRPSKVCLQEKKRSLQAQIKAYQDSVTEKKREIAQKVSSCVLKIKRLCYKCNRLHEVGKDVAELSKEVEDSGNLEAILVAEVKVKSLEDKQLLQFSPAGDEADDDDATDDDDSSVSEDMATDPSVSGAVGQQLTAADCVPAVSQRSRLDYRGGKLLLHSFTPRVDSRLFVQMPSEVFLELGVDGRCLGRVHILVQTHLRRAQQFMLLCLGILGPSYVGASFVITAPNQERETLDSRRYVLPDGSTSNRILMADLEWGGKFAGPAKEGVVMGSYYGTDTHGFGICTRGQLGGVFQCPFGEVLSGMEVIRAAVRHDPVTDVTITDCGLVVPDLAS
nr:tripartite motif-containing protein 65-like isoform X2 [Procambarus clarkii]